jgi:hypothetical protein
MSDHSEELNENQVQELCKRFTNGLLEHGIIYDDNFKQNFIFVGSDENYPELYLNNMYGRERFFKQFPYRRPPLGKGLPNHKDSCICKTHIKTNCYIFNRESKRLLIIGKCCAKRFIDNTLFKYKCIKCNIVKRKSKNTFCNDCKSNWRECSVPECKTIIDKRYSYCYNCNRKHKNIFN